MKPLVLKNVLDIDESKEIQSLKNKKVELEEELKNKEEYINFLTEKPPFFMSEREVADSASTTVNIAKLKREVDEMRKMNSELRLKVEENTLSMNNVWPHLMNIVRKQCNRLYETVYYRQEGRTSTEEI